MRHRSITLFLSGALLLTGCGQDGHVTTSAGGATDAAAGDEVPETKYYKNGVFRTDGQIYSVFRSDDWILGLSGNRMIESSDLVHWLRMGKKAFSTDEFQVADSSGLDIARIDDRYVMVYVAADGSIGMAESSRIRGPYHNSRTLLAKGADKSYGNPSFFCQGKSRWLVWDTPQGISIGKFKWDETAPRVMGLKQIGGDGFRAPRIVCRNGMYYLWATIRDSKGGIAVGRSRQLEGPYYTSDGIPMDTGGQQVVPTVIPNSEFSCVGNGSGIITDNNNDDWIIYHARTNLAGELGTVLMLDKIMWDNGWPVMSKLHASVAAQRQPRF